MVYFIQSESGPIKIGYSRSPKQRLASLQASNPDKLELLGVVRGGKDKESELHECFGHLAMAGEWFKAESDLTDYIKYAKEDWAEEEPQEIPATTRSAIVEIGRNIRLARLRRKMTLQALADQMGVGVRVVSNVESGEPGTGISNYFQALVCLGLAQDMITIASNDVVGRKMQDDDLIGARARS